MTVANTAHLAVAGCMQVWSKQITSQPKTYTFFYVTQHIALARSSAGAVAMLTRS